MKEVENKMNVDVIMLWHAKILGSKAQCEDCMHVEDAVANITIIKLTRSLPRWLSLSSRKSSEASPSEYLDIAPTVLFTPIKDT